MTGQRRWVGLGLIVLGGIWISGLCRENGLAAAAPTTTTASAASDNAPAVEAESTGLSPEHRKALVALVVGIVTVLTLIIAFKVNAFLALITAAIVVSLMAPGPVAEKISRVALAFGNSAGGIGIVIATAAVIGKCMLDSGAADRIVRSFLKLLGEKGAPVALMLSGYVLAVPVFFDTVFYLLVPLARSLYRKTNRNYLQYILAIGAGGAITHTLVPPTPGPLVMAAQLRFDVGYMILVGAIIAMPAAIAGLVFAHFMNRWMPVPMRALTGVQEPKPLADAELPPLWASLAPIVLPVLLITTNTVLTTMTKGKTADVDRERAAIQKQVEPGAAPTAEQQTELDRLDEETTAIKEANAQLFSAQEYSSIFGNASFALLLSTVVALVLLVVQRGLTRRETAEAVEIALMSGGVIILITAGGGAFGAMLKEAKVGDAIKGLFAVSDQSQGAGVTFLCLGFGIAAVLKVAQGSSTVAMITVSAMLAGVASATTLGFHPVYLATAIGGGSLVGSWMNDSGFWIFAKMGGLTEVEALKSWTVMLVVLGSVTFLLTLLLSQVMPLT